MLFGKAPVIVVRESAELVAIIQEALANAAPAERAGLQQALDLVEAQRARTEDEVVSQWVRGVLADAGIGTGGDHAEAVAALRKAVPDLALTTANDLVSAATGR
ncbi:hypothetical protein [Streptomyces fradiae]|uniref:hypothetical protein n=1 Tax=Streptomyces fradiae TaxID=1906 RepID=UPI0036919101